MLRESDDQRRPGSGLDALWRMDSTETGPAGGLLLPDSGGRYIF
jgi:hypothetical protein